MFQGSPNDVTLHLNRMSRKVPKGENPIEHLIDVIQEYDQSEVGVGALAEFARTGLKPPPLSDQEGVSVPSVVAPSPARAPQRGRQGHVYEEKSQDLSRLSQVSRRVADDYDHSVRSPYNNTSQSWSTSHSAAFLKFTPSRLRNEHKAQNPVR